LRPARGMVVAAHPIAAKAGAAVLRKGGNAVDAAVATSLMLGVVEPAFSGIGGGGFALLFKSNGESLALDYRETAPLGSSASMFADHSDKNRVGPLAIATPGVLAGHARLLEEHGTMKFADLARSAVNAADSGVRSESLSLRMLRDKESGPFNKISHFEASSNVFKRRNRFPVLAKTLVALAGSGPSAFYHGSIPERAARYLKDMGGVLSEEDFEKYSPKERKPVTGDFLGYGLVSMPPPSAGGTLLIHGLQVAEELDRKRSAREEAGRLPATAAVLGSMLREKWRFGDPEYTDVPVASFLSKTDAKKRAEEIRSREVMTLRESTTDVGSTSHFCVVDRNGNTVASTETIECYFGSGVTIPELGVIMNDEMHDFDVVPGRPNSVAPLKRPASSMTPSIVLKDGSPFLVLGGAGSERIISSVFQVVGNVIEGEMSLSDAVSSPRIHPSGETLEVEGGFGRGTLSELRRSGFKLDLRQKWDPYFGGVHAIMVDPRSGRTIGAADPRRMGSAAFD